MWRDEKFSILFSRDLWESLWEHGFILDGSTGAVIFVAEVALLGTLEMIEEVGDISGD